MKMRRERDRETEGAHHASQHLGGHDDARRIRVEGDVPGHQAHVPKLLVQLAVLLIAQRLRGETTPPPNLPLLVRAPAADFAQQGNIQRVTIHLDSHVP